ncbi:MAG TPA: AmmeMemoRadiSam system protein B [Patescibacteria group bacterium]|nr:AmmeMemoRadiSam system protein B [Patescibacteria group bacterium]
MMVSLLGLTAVFLLGFFLGRMIGFRPIIVNQKNAMSLETDRQPSQTFLLDGMEGIHDVVAAAERLEVPTTLFDGDPVHAALLPHHTLISEKIGSFWTRIAQRTNPSVIVLLAPAHENQGEALVQTARGIWKTPLGSIETEDAIVSGLAETGVVAEEPFSFVDEHGIGVHLPFIAKLFPQARIVPIIAKSLAGEREARALVSAFDNLLPEDTLLVSSVDFSHGLLSQESDQRDRETLALIAGRDYVRLDRLSSEFVDSPFALETFLLWTDREERRSQLVWHSNAGEFTGDRMIPGTSYVVFFAPRPKTSFTLTAVGDVMLGRKVADWLSQTTIEEALKEASSAVAGSDLIFANLESVFTRSETVVDKPIRFKGDPEMGTDALTFMGFTQVSVANNHVNDYGEAAWKESIGYLKTAGIDPVGGYRNDGVPVIAELRDRRVVFLAFDDLNRRIDLSSASEQIQSAHVLGDLLIVSFHWGNEYEHFPIQRQKDLAHRAIDAGADLVIGHHPHVLQGMEKYKDGLILYSLGNFIFDQIGEDENESVVAKIQWEGSKWSVEFIPMRIKRGFPRFANEEEKQATFRWFAQGNGEQLNESE